ncbi:uroporphyrinogen-III synthase [Methylophilaceae bacterium]|nr:uroporphyrinogen-III synthase [Methylophilaceae bacterium]|tara:strand:- start:4916 stop:5692 length:777 start_codon:yes stop_codon:yes gene_type:complete
MSLNTSKKNIALISTRPYEKNITLFKDIENENILLLNYPLTEIKPLADYSKFDLTLSNLDSYQHVIFISTNAVHYFAKRIKNLKIKMPNDIIFSSVGPKTREALKNQFNINVFCPEENFDSEHLIKNKIFDKLQDKKVLIIRGTGGRETLKNLLEEKGAKVDYGECYIRNYLTINQKKLNQELKNSTKIFILITSYDSAFQLNQSPGQWIGGYKTKFIVNHKKIEFSLKNGNYGSQLDNVIVTKDLSAKSLIDIILAN